MRGYVTTIAGGTLVGLGAAAAATLAAPGLDALPLALLGSAAGTLWAFVWPLAGQTKKQTATSWEPVEVTPKPVRPEALTVIPLGPGYNPEDYKPPVVSVQQQWEENIAKTIARAWIQSTRDYERLTPGQYAVDVQRPIWYSSYVVFPLQLSRLLPTPKVERVVSGPFAMALRAALSQMTKRVDMVDRVSARLRHSIVEITLPRPGKAPDLHVANLVRAIKPGVPMNRRSPDGDLYALIGIDTEDRPVYADFALTPVVFAVGATRSGKTALTFGALAGLLATNGPSRVHLYIVGARGDQWRDFAALPHCRGYAFDPDGAAGLLLNVMQTAQHNARIDSNKTHPSVILVVDDLSGVSQWPTWQQLREALTYITMSGGGANVYTWITSHRTTEAGGVGTGARAIVLNAGCRLATATQGGPPILADHLGITLSQAEALPMPQARLEAAISIFGEPPRILRTVYAKDHEIHSFVKNNATYPWTHVDSSVDVPPPYTVNGATEATDLRPPERNRGVVDYGGDYTYGELRQDYTPELHPTTGADQQKDVTENAVPLSGHIRREVLERDGYACAWCMAEGTESAGPDGHAWEVDHVIPRARGGGNELDNLVTSCRSCNRQKSSMTGAEFIKAQLLKLDGNVPTIRKVRGRYAATSWDQLQVWYAHEMAEVPITTIAEIALGGSGKHQNDRIREFVGAGRQLYASIKKGSANA